VFTVVAVLGGALVAWLASGHDISDPDANLKHARQDLRLIAFLLFRVLVMLGVVADRIH